VVNVTTPDDMVAEMAAFNHPSLEEVERLRRSVTPADATLAHLRAGLDGERYLRWATAVTLARLGVSDGDELALLVVREFDWSLIPGGPFVLWEGAMWHLRDAAAGGRATGTAPYAIEALTHADPSVVYWTDVIDEAVALLWEEPSVEALPALRRVALEHWDGRRREDAADLVKEIEGDLNRRGS
jgi:hypothetical protein